MFSMASGSSSILCCISFILSKSFLKSALISPVFCSSTTYGDVSIRAEDEWLWLSGGVDKMVVSSPALARVGALVVVLELTSLSLSELFITCSWVVANEPATLLAYFSTEMPIDD